MCQCNDHAVCACQKVNTFKFQSLFISLFSGNNRKESRIDSSYFVNFCSPNACLYEYITIFLKNLIRHQIKWEGLWGAEHQPPNKNPMQLFSLFITSINWQIFLQQLLTIAGDPTSLQLLETLT